MLVGKRVYIPVVHKSCLLLAVQGYTQQKFSTVSGYTHHIEMNLSLYVYTTFNIGESYNTQQPKYNTQASPFHPIYPKANAKLDSDILCVEYVYLYVVYVIKTGYIYRYIVQHLYLRWMVLSSTQTRHLI